MVPPVTILAPPISERASERFTWARRWRPNEVAAVISKDSF